MFLNKYFKATVSSSACQSGTNECKAEVAFWGPLRICFHLAVVVAVIEMVVVMVEVLVETVVVMMVVVVKALVVVFHPRAKRGLTYAGYLSSKMVQGLLF